MINLLIVDGHTELHALYEAAFRANSFQVTLAVSAAQVSRYSADVVLVDAAALGLLDHAFLDYISERPTVVLSNYTDHDERTSLRDRATARFTKADTPITSLPEIVQSVLR